MPEADLDTFLLTGRAQREERTGARQAALHTYIQNNATGVLKLHIKRSTNKFIIYLKAQKKQ